MLTLLFSTASGWIAGIGAVILFVLYFFIAAKALGGPWRVDWISAIFWLAVGFIVVVLLVGVIEFFAKFWLGENP